MGVDLQPVNIRLPENAAVHTGDILSADESLLTNIGRDYHAVLSDMAPATTGQKSVDAARSYHLCQAALEIAVKTLLPGGIFVSKIFQGEDFQDFRTEVGEAFDKLRIFKPQSSRKASREIYIIGIGRR